MKFRALLKTVAELDVIAPICNSHHFLSQIYKKLLFLANFFIKNFFSI